MPVTGVVDRTQMHDVLRQWGGLPKASWKPDAFRFVASTANFGGKRSIPWGPHTVHDFLHAKLVVCDDWAFAGSYNHSRAGEENAENVLAMDGKAAADRVAEAIREFAALYASGPGDPWDAARLSGARQLDGRRPQLAPEPLEHRAPQLRHVNGQRQRVLAQAGEQRRALEHLIDPGAVAGDDELVERGRVRARGSPRPARSRGRRRRAPARRAGAGSGSTTSRPSCCGS